MSGSAVKALNHVAIGVRDLEASLRFYTEGLEKPVSDNVWRLPGDIGAFQLSFPVDPEHIGPLHERLVTAP
jgi:lactoylglutathione lyase